MGKKDLTIMNNGEYIKMLEKIKNIYKNSQLKATFSVNSEMLKFYYNLGEEIISFKGRKHMGK